MKSLNYKSTLLIITSGIGILLFILWSVFFHIDESSHAQGQIIASERTQVIQSLIDGELEAILVAEGDAVKKGQIIARLDTHRAEAEYKESLAKVMALKITLVRLKAEVFGSEPNFGPDFADWPEYVSNQKALFDRRQKALHEAVDAEDKILKSIQAEINITAPLVSQGDVGKLEVLQLRRQESETEGQIVNIKNKYFQDAQSEMTKTEEMLASETQVMSERLNTLQHTNIDSPVNGFVKKIQIHTQGAAVRNGETILELVPSEGGLVVEANFSPKDIAFLKQGMPSFIKIDAYDYSIYGQAQGVVQYISPDALTDTDPRSPMPTYYRVLIKVTQLPDKQARGNPIKLQPGMTAQVQVVTGKRTIFQYMMKPLMKTFSESLNER